jgi:hypothetical protein
VEQPISFVRVLTELLSAQACQYQHRGYTNCKTGANIGDTIAYEDSIIQVDAHLISRKQYHSRTRFAAAAVLIFAMWTVVYLLYSASGLRNFGK